MNDLGWELGFSIRPPRVFKILSKKFQWTQTIDPHVRDWLTKPSQVP